MAIILTLISAVYLLLLARLALSHGIHSRTHVALAGSLLMLVIWVLAVFGLQFEFAQQVIYARMVFQIGLLTVVALLWLIVQVTARDRVRLLVRRLNILMIAASCICWTPWVIEALERRGGVPLPVYGPLIWIYVAMIAVCITAIIVLLVRGASAGSAQYRMQVRTIGASLLAATGIALATNLILPALFNDATIALLLPVAALVLATGLSYAIAKQGFLELKTVAVRSAAYTLSIGALALIYFILAYLLSLVLIGSQASGTNAIHIILVLAIALLFQPIKHFFDWATDKLFYRHEYNRDHFFAELGSLLAHTTDMQLLLRRTSRFFERVFKADRALLIARHSKRSHLLSGRRVAVSAIPQADIDIMLSLAGRAYGYNHVILQETVNDQSLADIMRVHNIALIMPLALKKEAIGCLLMGEHEGRGYTKRDLSLIESASGELVIALNNARSIEVVQELNRSLQQRIDAATKELRASNRQLLRLDEAKNEFISMASHQLRTPLTSIKGYLDMVLEGDLGRITPTQRTVLKEAFSSSERMVRLINDFLNVSRLQTGKFVIDRRPANLATIIKEEVALIEVVAKQRNIAIELTVEGDMPPLLLDEEKIRQVAMNFMDNAVYYSHPDTVITVRLAREKNEVVFTVKDTGIGVPKAEQADLFGKFFRATNARKRRPDGTGVGLFLARKVILSHEGEIIFTSEEGKGSTFGFRLPL